ncbi:unnamed protein product [Caenorhabditis bovis]|uniref:Transmembrane protein n=1 Tax=Caenorhabditis bovis TaxID=2654633 RepID=A0A8S1F8M2_9PELO|nr:unnamed protein product [Caenorhabditis bovis]
MPPKGSKKAPNVAAEKTTPQILPPVQQVATKIQSTSGLTVSVHPAWPDMQFTQGELFFECTLFLYSVLALFLQYLNLYKTLWWLPKSYWHFSIITDTVASISFSQRPFIQTVLMVTEYAVIKTPLMTLVITSFLFSFTRVCNDYPLSSILYFFFPILLYSCVFYNELIAWVVRFGRTLGEWRKGRIEFAEFVEKMCEGPSAQIDLDSVLHMCSDNPAQIREEVDVLIDDLMLRAKRSYYAGISTTFMSVLLPCVFVPHKTTLGVPQQILINEFWEYQLGLIVGLTAFSHHMTYLLPLNYLDLLHRAAIHLGCWETIEGPKIGHMGSMSQSPSPWLDSVLYNEGDTVQMPDGRCYRARSSKYVKTIAAHPEKWFQYYFFKFIQKPLTLINWMCMFEFSLIFIQFWMLVLTNDWQHIVTFVLLMFANYMLFAKLFKDRIILGRIYEPSQEDLLLVRQLQEELSKSNN